MHAASFPTLRLFSAILSASTLLAAAPVAAAGDPPASASLEVAVRELIGNAACTSHEQCRTIAVGTKACGGPLAYLAWSTQRTDEAALKAAVARYTAAQQAEQKAGGMVSNCVWVADPGAYCAPSAPADGTATQPASTCQLRSVRPRGAVPQGAN